jgi:predicted 3-demethylubiquinone-9 3-methyltransferase (glyoxalase superfamily)
MQKITPFFWFEKQAEEAANFYVSIFPNSKITTVNRYDEASAKASGQAAGSAMVVAFELNGQQFSAINGGAQPFAKPSGMVSFVINCETQDEVDHFWSKLSEGGEEGQCGWINHDKFGITWQVVPTALPKLLGDKDPARAQRAMMAMLKMKKIDIAELEKAAAGE